MSDLNDQPAEGATPEASLAGQEAAEQRAAEDQPRRRFIVEAIAFAIGGIITLVPVVLGTIFFFDPLIRRRKSKDGGDGFVPIGTTNALPSDGTPFPFKVVADKSDAWNQYPNVEVGMVYLRKTADGKVVAFNARCPHLGCSVDYKPAADAFVCPCHDSAFSLEGERTNNIPPRDLDALEVEVRNGNEIWVKFQNFRAGTELRIPVS